MNKNLPALMKGYTSFVMPVEESPFGELPAEIASEVKDDVNKTYYEQSRDSFPFVSIRQKDLKDGGGKTIYTAGGFKYQNTEVEVPDADGSIGLLFSALADQDSRVYFESLQDPKPTCKSIDGKSGSGNPGGVCSACPLGQFGANGESPKCSQNMNIFCFDHTIKDANPTYIFNIGPSGLKAWANCKGYLKRQKTKVPGGAVTVPINFVRLLVTTKFVNEKGGYYIPEFKVVDILALEPIKEIKAIQTDYCEVFKKAVADTEVESEHQAKLNDELPADADDLRTDGQQELGPDYR